MRSAEFSYARFVLHRFIFDIRQPAQQISHRFLAVCEIAGKSVRREHFVGVNEPVESFGLRVLARGQSHVFDNGAEGLFCVVWSPNTLEMERVVISRTEVSGLSDSAVFQLGARRFAAACDKLRVRQ
jgi:hypothetical protein